MPGVPPRLDAVIRRLLRKDPAQRFGRAQDVLDELQPLLDVIESQHAGVVGRALHDPSTTVSALKDAHKNALVNQADATLKRSPPGRHEAAYALNEALRLWPSDVAVKRRLEAVVKQHRVRIGNADLDDLSPLSAAELRRAGLDAFDEGAVGHALRRLRRYQRLHPQQADKDPIAIGRLTLIEGSLDAPLALRTATTTASLALAPARPKTSPPMPIERRRRASRWPLAAALAVGVLVGVIATGSASDEGEGDVHVSAEASVLYRNAIAAERDGDTDTATLLFNDVIVRAGDSALGADAGLHLATIVEACGDVRRAREVVARVLAMSKATSEQHEAALKRLNAL